MNIDEVLNADEQHSLIDGYPGYAVTTEGRVFSSKSGHWREMRQSPRRGGYLRVTLRAGEAKRSINVHRLVATAFIPNPENKPQINHINSIRDDNRLVNLAWVTHSENMLHGFKYGHMKSGEHHHKAKLTDDAARQIYLRLLENPALDMQSMADEYNVLKNVIKGIKYRYSYRHVTEDLPDIHVSDNIGGNRPNAKLSDEDAVKIYKRFLNGETAPAIAADYGVKESTVKNIKRGATFKHVTRDLPKQSQMKRPADDFAHTVCQLLEKGLKSEEIVAEIGNPLVNKTTVYDIKRRKTYKKISCNYSF